MPFGTFCLYDILKTAPIAEIVAVWIVFGSSFSLLFDSFALGALLSSISNSSSLFALINLLGFIWSFIWIFYVTLCLSDDTLSQLLFVATLIYISLHIISSLPSLSRLSELCTINKRSMMEDSGQFGYRFFTSSLGVDISPLMSRKHSTISPRRVTFADESEYDEDDDPILFTAPIYESNSISSMTQLIQAKEQHDTESIINQDLNDSDISEDTDRLGLDLELEEDSNVQKQSSRTEKQIETESVDSQDGL
eukprot:487863_1